MIFADRLAMARIDPTQTLIGAIADWDQKSNETIEQTYNRFCGQPKFAVCLIDMLKEENLQVGATWLLKRFVETEGPLSGRSFRQLILRLDRLASWQAKLHVLQVIPLHRISLAVAEHLILDLRSLLNAENKFVRAWTYAGFHHLAREQARYAPEAKRVLSRAERVETAASVRVRIRKAFEAGFD